MSLSFKTRVTEYGYQAYQALRRIMLLAFLVSGFVLLFALPPADAPDEEGHFVAGAFRVESFVAEGQLPCPPILFGQAFGLWTEPKGPTRNKVPVGAPEAARTGENLEGSCSPFANAVYGHILSYPGIVFARALIRNPFEPDKYTSYFYLSRIGQFLFLWIVLVRLSTLMRVSPVVRPGALIIFGLFLTPIATQQSIAVSADGVVNAFAVCAFSILAFHSIISKVDVLLYLIVGTVAVFTKPVLMPVCLSIFVLLLLKTEGKNWKDRIRQPGFQIALISGVLVFACFLAYSMQVNRRAVVPLSYANPSKQIAFILQNPLKVLSLFLSQMNSDLASPNLFGPLGWFNIPLSPRVKTHWRELRSFFCSVEVLLLVTQFSIQPLRFLTLRKVAPFLVQVIAAGVGFFGLGFATISAMYLYWNPVGTLGRIEGLQGRYYIPVIIIGLGYLAHLLQSSMVQSVDSHTRPTAAGALANQIIRAGVYCWIAAVFGRMIIAMTTSIFGQLY